MTDPFAKLTATEGGAPVPATATEGGAPVSGTPPSVAAFSKVSTLHISLDTGRFAVGATVAIGVGWKTGRSLFILAGIMTTDICQSRFSPRRELGRTRFKATILGIGDLADRKVPLAECVATVHRAMDTGLNVIDTAPGYEEGYSEQIVGAALRGRRDGMFVIDKIDQLDQPVAPQIDASLGRLGIDHTDLFVFHGVSTLDQWRQLRFDELAACVKAGKTRFRGISCHNPEVLREAIPSGLCDVVMFPVGPFVDERYVTAILPLAKQRGVGTVCFKTFGGGKLLGDTEGYGRPLASRPRGKLSSGGADASAPVLPRLTVSECLHYTLTLDPDVALLGLSFPNEQEAAFSAATAFRPLAVSALDGIRRAAATAIEGKGACWWNPK
jgi:aryl-alcohol dehydrogenase-like predicted oxidoreductase